MKIDDQNEDSHAISRRLVMSGSLAIAAALATGSASETVAAPETVIQVYEGMKDKFTPERLLASTQKLFYLDFFLNGFVKFNSI